MEMDQKMEDERGLLLKQILVWNTLLVMMMWNTVLGPKLTFVYIQSVLYIGHLKISDNKINYNHTQIRLTQEADRA